MTAPVAPPLHQAASCGDVALVRSLLASADHGAAERSSALLAAASSGHLAVVELLVSCGADATFQSPKEQSTALHLAALHGHVPIVKYLLTLSEVVERIDDMVARGSSTLLAAVQKGHVEIVQLLLDHGADTNVSRGSLQPLLAACASAGNRPEIVKLLLLHGANVNAPTKYGTMTPLHYAVFLGSVELAALLLDAGADLKSVSERERMSPLHLAVREGDMAMIQFLVSRGADVDSKTPYRDTTALFTAVECGHLAVIKYLLSVGAERPPYICPMTTAAEQGYTDILEFLVAEGWDMDWPYEHDARTLCSAVMSDNVDALRILLAAGASESVNTEIGDGRTDTVMHFAAQYCNAEGMELLIAHGGNIHCQTRFKHTPFFVAAMHGRIHILDVLLKNGADPFVEDPYYLLTATHAAASSGRLGVLEYLLENKLTRDFENTVEVLGPLLRAPQAGYPEHSSEGLSPMSVAARAGHLDIVEFLVRYQDATSNNPDAPSRKSQRTEALHYAVRGGHLEIVRLLCDNGASTDLLSPHNTTMLQTATALHTAAEVENLEMIEYLLEVQHADIHAHNSTGMTPLMYAAISGAPRAANALVAHGAAVNGVVEGSPDALRNGATAAHFAAAFGNIEVLEALLRHGADVNATNHISASVVDFARSCIKKEAYETGGPMDMAQVVAFLHANGATETSDERSQSQQQ